LEIWHENHQSVKEQYKTHERFMREALKEANIAFSKEEIPIGAIVVCHGKIVARSHNLTEILNDATAHAEMQAITAAANHIGSKYLNECILYVTVEPCIMCGAASAWSQLGTLIYGTSDEKKGFSTIPKKILHPKTKIIGGILAEECKELMQLFFKKKRE